MASASATSASEAPRCWPITSVRSRRSSRRPVEELERVREIGPVLAEAVRTWFDEPRNRELVARLREAGLKTTGERKVAPAGPQPLAGKTFVITGTLEALSREDAEARIAALGGKVTGSVSKKTSYLIVGVRPGQQAGQSSCPWRARAR